MAAPAFEHPAITDFAAPRLLPHSSALVIVMQTIASWESRSRTRSALRDVAPERLPDLGLTTAEVQREVAKPFWRP